LGRDTNLQFVKTPVPVAGGHTFSAIAAGDYHTCAIEVGGAAYCWGSNVFGAVGTGDTGSRTPHPIPEAVAGGHLYKAIDGGNVHTCALTRRGEAYCWGSGVFGQVGDGTQELRRTPVLVSGGRTFTALSLGSGHSCALATGGQLYCWGYDAVAQLGAPAPHSCHFGALGDSVPCAKAPVAAAGALRFRTVAAGGFHTCAIGSGGGAYCWGSNGEGQLGHGDADNVIATAVRVADP
jgi:alpha-tubulin suppressor-like RCC1 family protein